MPESLHTQILNQLEQERRWFRARKTKPLWAKRATDSGTLETLEGPVTYQAGEYICRGAADDYWVQPEAILLEKYDESAETDDDGWSCFAPKLESNEVEAAAISEAFEVSTPRGPLSGKANDYIVRKPNDNSDVWIVDREIFESTYSRID